MHSVYHQLENTLYLKPKTTLTKGISKTIFALNSLGMGSHLLANFMSKTMLSEAINSVTEIPQLRYFVFGKK